MQSEHHPDPSPITPDTLKAVATDAATSPRRLRGLTARLSSSRSIARSVSASMRTNHVNIAAGAFAFRWFLAIFPIIIALLGIATLVAIPSHVVLTLLSGVTKALPSGASTVFTDAIRHATERSRADVWTVVIASIVGLWSSTSGMVVIEEGLDMVYGLPRDRSFLVKRVLALPLLLAATVFGSAASTLIIFGPQLGNELRHSIPLAGASFSVLWTILRWLLAMGLMNLLISIFYFLAPNHSRPKWRWSSAGSLFATIVWAVISLGFSFYTSSFGSYGRTYGAFAGVAILIFWLYLTGLAILVGAEIDTAVQHLNAPSGPDLGSTSIDDLAKRFDDASSRFAARLRRDLHPSDVTPDH